MGPHEAGAPPVKETRQVWWADGYATTDIYEMDDVGNGQTIDTRPRATTPTSPTSRFSSTRPTPAWSAAPATSRW